MASPPIGRSVLGHRHETGVLETLRVHGALSRGQLARLVGLSRTTISEVTTQLLERGAVVVLGTDSTTRRGSGRPAERLALDPSSGQHLGIDFGHRRVQVAIADATHQVIAEGVERYSEETDWHRRIDLTLAMIDRIISTQSIHLAALQAIGIGVPGPYMGATGNNSDPVRSNWSAHELVQAVFAERFESPVLVDNNTRFAALAEAVSRPDPASDLIYVRLADGVGGGLVVAGHLVTGTRGLAGEFGHVTAVPDGLLCRCGRRGCLETVASTSAIFAASRAHGVDVNDIAGLAAAAVKGDPDLDTALQEIGSALGRTLAGAAMILNPDEIVVGGEVVHAAPALIEGAAAALHDELRSVASAESLRIRAGQLRDGDGALGALAAVFHHSSLLSAYPNAEQSMQVSLRRRAQ